jgi:hypothetical protein
MCIWRIRMSSLSVPDGRVVTTNVGANRVITAKGAAESSVASGKTFLLRTS